jgi:hypothetical protein
MTKIWKFHLPIEDEVTIAMPWGATVLTVAVQRGQPCLWAVVDPERPYQPRRFAVRGTGLPAEGAGTAEWSYVGTFQFRPVDGVAIDLVFHVFEMDQG